MQKRASERLNIQKAVLLAIVLNAAQILAVVAFTLVLVRDGVFEKTGYAELGLACFAALVVVWGAVIDIGEAFNARKIAEQSAMLEDANRQMEALNGTLRSQRHDFMNHLQVVFSLTEMAEYDEARDYIARVYGDIRRIGRVLRTAVPAVNALIAAKSADCERQGISFRTDISSNWKDMPVPGWEMCRVLGNLIDNAMDALREQAVSEKRIALTLGEDVRAFTFSVENNGPAIDETIRAAIFEMGFTTKRAGRGMGLHIVSEIMRDHGGSIVLENGDAGVCFRGSIPKPVSLPAPGSEICEEANS